MTLKIVLTGTKKKRNQELESYIEVPARHLCLFYNIWIKWDTSGGFLRNIDIENHLATFVVLRNSKETIVDTKTHTFYVHKDTLNCKSLYYVLDLEQRYLQLKENYETIHHNLKYFEQ